MCLWPDTDMARPFLACMLDMALTCRLATLPVQHQRWVRPESAQPMFNREESSPGQVVGTVEVSLVPSTRTRYLTLNAPEVLPEPYPSTYTGNSSIGHTCVKQCSTGAVWALLPQPGALCLPIFSKTA